MSEEIFFHLHKFAWNSHIYLSIHYRIWTLNYPQLFSGYVDVCVYGIDGDCGAIKILQCGWEPHALCSSVTKSIVCWKRTDFCGDIYKIPFLFGHTLKGTNSAFSDSFSDLWCIRITNYLLHLGQDPLLPPHAIWFLVIIFILITYWHIFLNKAFLLVAEKNNVLPKFMTFFVIFLIMSPWQSVQKHFNIIAKWNNGLKN